MKHGSGILRALIAQTPAPAPKPAMKPVAQPGPGGGVQVGTANNPKDDDSTWVQEIDMDGDGNVEQTSLVRDHEDKILFAYSSGTFTCRNGANGAGGPIIGVNPAGNTRNRPTGSGFEAAEVDETEYASAAAGIVAAQN